MGLGAAGSLEQPAEINPKKPFASLICGDMKPGDLLFAGTQNFEPLRNQLRLAETLKSLPPVAAALELRQELERHLTDHGCDVLREGAKHTIWRNRTRDLRAPVPRHREIPIGTARAICRQLGVPPPLGPR